MTITSRDLPIPDRALAIGAHPDDIEFGAGATLSRWTAAGCDVSLIICTDGSKGSWDANADIVTLVTTRKSEQRMAAVALRATGRIRFLGQVDGDLAADRETISEVARLVRVLRPNVVLGHDPWRRHRLHPDHRAAGQITVEAVVAARDPHFFPEHDVPHHRPDTMLLFETDAANHAESTTSAALDAKLAALEAHRSQFISTMFISSDDPAAAGAERERFHRRIRDEAALAGRRIGRAGAELFNRLPTDR